MCDVIGESGPISGVDKIDEGSSDPHVPGVSQDHRDRVGREHDHA